MAAGQSEEALQPLGSAMMVMEEDVFLDQLALGL